MEGHYCPAAEVGNPASLDKVFFFTDYFSLGYMQYIQVGVEFLQFKIFKMVAAKKGRFVIRDVHFW